jgi:hypothetical protein
VFVLAIVLASCLVVVAVLITAVVLVRQSSRHPRHRPVPKPDNEEVQLQLLKPGKQDGVDAGGASGGGGSAEPMLLMIDPSKMGGRDLSGIILALRQAQLQASSSQIHFEVGGMDSLEDEYTGMQCFLSVGSRNPSWI